MAGSPKKKVMGLFCFEAQHDQTRLESSYTGFVIIIMVAISVLLISSNSLHAIGVSNTVYRSNLQRILLMLGAKFCLQRYYPRDEEIVYRYMSFDKFNHLISSKEFLPAEISLLTAMKALKQNWGEISAKQCTIAMLSRKIRNYTNEIVVV